MHVEQRARDLGAAYGGVIPPSEPRSSSSSRTCSSLVNEIRGCTRGQGSVVRRQISRAEQLACSAAESGSFRRPVVRRGGGVQRSAALPRLTPLSAAEWVVARASPSPTRDAFSIGDSNRNTNRGFDVTSFHGTRSHDRGTRAEWNQSPVPHRLSAKGIAPRTVLPEYPCLAPVLGSHRRSSHRGRAAGSAGAGQRERLLVVAVPSIPPSDDQSHCSGQCDAGHGPTPETRIRTWKRMVGTVKKSMETSCWP